MRRDKCASPLRDWLNHDVEPAALADFLPDGFLDDEVGVELLEDAAYAPYVARQEGELRELRASENVRIPPAFAFDSVPGLSNEMIERLSAASPETISAASRVRGVTPTALAAVLVQVRRVPAGAT